MKRIALAVTVTTATFLLGLLALALAQRDARNRSEETVLRPTYSQQSPDPIAARLSQDSDVHMASDHGVPPLDVPPPLSSQSVIRANDQAADQSNPLRSPAPMLSAPSLTPAGNGQNSQFQPPASSSLMSAPAFSANPNASAGSSPSLQGSGTTPTMMPPSFSSTARLGDGGGSGSEASATRSPTLPNAFNASRSTASLSDDQGASPSGSGLPNALNAPSPTSGSQGLGSQGFQAPAPLNATSPSMPAPLSTLSQGGNAGSSLGGPVSAPPAFQPSALSNNSPAMPTSGQPASDRSLDPRASMQANSSQANAAPMVTLRDRPNGNGSSSLVSTPLSNSPQASAARGNASYENDSNRNYGSSAQGSRGPSARLASASSGLVAERPGLRKLDGAQNPSLQLQKRAPEEVQVGQPATFTLIVRNVGNASAHDVTIVDRVPVGTRFARSTPQTDPDAQGNLTWSLGEMAAGAEQTIVMELIPETEGELGSVASVSFASQASVRTMSTQPKLELTQVMDPKVLIGNSLDIRIQISNVGTGVARDIILVEEVSSGFKHPKGPSMELEAFHLEPGESRTIPLELLAIEPGMTQNIVRATSANAAPVESSLPVQVVAPQLQVSISGPKLRYLERQATYQITLTNPGTAVARDIDIVANLPRGLQFNNAGNDGEYVSNKHMVVWGLEELGPGETATTDLVVMPIEEGDFVVRVQGQAKDVRPETIEKPVKVEGQSELAFSIEDDNDPIETDGFTTYVVKVTNIGTRGDRNVQVMVELPQGSEVLQVQAPVAHQAAQGGLTFEPIQEMRAKDQLTYRFSVRLPREGTQVVRAFVKSQQRPVAVVKEESTQVYADK